MQPSKSNDAFQNESRADPNLQTKTVLVTGAARRLGREIALGFARAGWDVAVHYGHSQQEALETVEAIRTLGCQAIAVQADLADETATRAMFERACHEFGQINCLVNSASRFEFDRPERFSYQALEDHVAPNLAAPLLLTQQMHAATAANAQGVVINLLDQKLENLNPDFFSYTLTKAALLFATKMMATAFAPRLRVVAVSPGITLVSGEQSADGFANAHRMTPLGRSSRPEDIVQAVLYLANATAVTGVNLPVDGGQHLMPLDRDVMHLVEPGISEQQPSSDKPS